MPRCCRGAAPCGWAAPGARCDVFFRCKWHRGVVEAYTLAEAIVKLDKADLLLPVNLVADAGKVCWLAPPAVDAL